MLLEAAFGVQLCFGGGNSAYYLQASASLEQAIREAEPALQQGAAGSFVSYSRYVFGPRGKPLRIGHSVCPTHAQTRTYIMLGHTPQCSGVSTQVGSRRM